MLMAKHSNISTHAGWILQYFAGCIFWYIYSCWLFLPIYLPMLAIPSNMSSHAGYIFQDIISTHADYIFQCIYMCWLTISNNDGCKFHHIYPKAGYVSQYICLGWRYISIYLPMNAGYIFQYQQPQKCINRLVVPLALLFLLYRHDHTVESSIITVNTPNTVQLSS